MNREIKFKIWDKYKKEFVNDLLIDLNGQVCRNDCQLYKNPTEVLQYTGLKDKNDKEIYEGDIIKLNEGWKEMIHSDRSHCIVGFAEGAFMFGRSFDPNYMDSYLWMSWRYCEVVGNIYENPELMEVK